MADLLDQPQKTNESQLNPVYMQVVYSLTMIPRLTCFDFWLSSMNQHWWDS